MSARLPVPKQVVVHGFLFNRGEKMSKSVGNVVGPKEMVEAYGLDPVRYFFLREVPFGQDGSYSHEAIVARMNADLANDIGNLAQRSLTMIARNGARTPDWRKAEPVKEDLAMLARADALIGEARRHMQSFALNLYIGAVFEVVSEANRYFANAEPWRLARSDPARMGLVLYVTIETLRIAAILLQPAMPASMGALLDLLSVPPEARTFAALDAGERKWQSRCSASARAGQGAAPACAGLSSLRRGGVRALAWSRRRMTLIDSHCHLDFPDFADDLDGVVERARAAGVERMITIGTKVSKAAGVVAIAERYDDVFFTVGTHPHEAAGEGAEDFDAMRAFAQHPKCVGIGEAGLDYHYDYAPRDVAQRVFRGQIALARELDLPLVIHARDADDDIAAILTDEMGQGRFRALLHCFTSSRELAETALDLGLSISFSGVVTFKKSEGLRAIARDVPLDRILVETDAPYLAPTPHRGRRNEPAFVVATAGVVAEARGLEPEALAAATRANTHAIFRRLPPTAGKLPQAVGSSH